MGIGKYCGFRFHGGEWGMGSTNWKSEVAFMVIAPVLVGLGEWALASPEDAERCGVIAGRLNQWALSFCDE